MRRAKEHSGTIGILVCVGIAAAALGCGGSQLGIPTGHGGAVPGVGGATERLGTGGTSLGAGGVTTGAGGATGTGGRGTGGLVVGNRGGSKGTGGRATGGAVGEGGRTTVVSGTGGRDADAGAAGSGAGGRGTGGGGRGAGGRTSGGTGGAGMGGATGSDGGAPDGTPAKCIDITTQSACDARGDCHSVFVDPGTCGCAASGCCAHFDSCADGEKANCTGPALCKMMEPFCESPYTIAFEGSCYEGCVRQTDCAPADCPQAAPADGSACGLVPVGQTCYYEDCAGAGRTLATCTPGESKWKVTTTACTTVACDTSPVSGRGTICAEGKVCIIAGSDNIVSILPALPIFACADHTCGTGPITADCITTSYGPCTPSYSAAGAVFLCEM